MSETDFPVGASAARLQATREAAQAQGIRTLLVRNTSNIQWATAFDGVFDEEQAHALLVTPHDAILHTDSRYSGAACAAAQREGVVQVNDESKSHGKFVADIFAKRHTQASESSGEEGSAANNTVAAAIVLGIEDSMTLASYRQLEAAFKKAGAAPTLKETSNFVLNLRAVKDAAEIARMKAAQAVTDAAFTHICEFVKAARVQGVTEREVQIELEDWMRRHGASGLAFSSIVASGANGASPHAIPGSKKLQAGECVVLDFGARAYGYCSDMTRTVFLGEPSERLCDAYAAIRDANETVEAKLAPGVTGKQAHELAEKILADHGFAGKMGHGLGHGVGIDIHEQPVLSPRNEAPLEAGNVVTVEPGVYLDGEFGMRLEDFGVVTDAGYEVFTQSPHEMVIL